MTKLLDVLKQPFPNSLGRFRYGTQMIGAFYIVALLYLNIAFIFSAISGKMQLSRRFEWIEGRESSPMFYWCYLAGLGAVVIAIDSWILHSVLKSHREKRTA